MAEYSFPVELGQEVYMPTALKFQHWERMPKIVSGKVSSFRITKRGSFIKIAICADWLYIDNGFVKEHSNYNRYFSYPVWVLGDTVFTSWEEADDARAKFEASERIHKIAKAKEAQNEKSIYISAYGRENRR